ncbi:lipid-A-disaccharide synthase-related protein [Chamaesiphon sp. VAR_48_metabat_135_sub]|uniref:lipid-A-disaccharide synthase-related protein n=1 Tax=Chamaesiphon sp. VAR_48_metabat_135_sub TaxID=2964699 RepID=UPI00286BEC4E|nr:lipid-A-disaccharide synthase-related protein [Chamaesiphon sp. VAR_48_metabat_135_sub]
MKLLCISNGHGEDAIALPVLQELRKLPKPPEIVTLPIVGVGKAYSSDDFSIVGNVQTMPSGGFLNQDNRQLVRDLRGGLAGLTIDQMRTVRNWSKSGGKILAVGDIVPLLFAWLSGADYAFIGTAKSEYYIRDSQGNILASQRDSIEVKTGSYYFPWERWLLSRSRCKAVFPRDKLTAEILQQHGIPAFDLGNPMTDGVSTDPNTPIFYQPQSAKHELARPLIVTLLPGSRPPEAYANWAKILIAVNSLIPLFKQREIIYLAAITPTLDLDVLQGNLGELGWVQVVNPDSDLTNLIPDRMAIYYRRDHATIVISTQAYPQCMQKGDCAIAMAGTATEQFIGLGKPAFTIPGAGPQFTPGFAEAQTRLLGESVILVPQPQDVGVEMQRLLQQPDRLQSIARNGLLRMGTPGAAKRIAECLVERI